MSTVTGGATDVELGAPADSGPRKGRVVVFPAHGGSGSSTVARSLNLAEVRDRSALADVRTVIITARSTTDGFDRLLLAVAGLPDSICVVVAATADAPLRAPAGVRARARMLQRGSRTVSLVNLPYEPSWRHSPADGQRPSTSYRRQLSKLAAVINHEGIRA